MTLTIKSKTLQVFQGFFQLTCDEIPNEIFLGNHHIMEWFNSLDGERTVHEAPVDRVIKEFTIAVVR